MQPGDLWHAQVGEEVWGEGGKQRGIYGAASRSVYSVLFKLHKNLSREGGGDCYSHLRAAEWG